MAAIPTTDRMNWAWNWIRINAAAAAAIFLFWLINHHSLSNCWLIQLQIIQTNHCISEIRFHYAFNLISTFAFNPHSNAFNWISENNHCIQPATVFLLIFLSLLVFCGLMASSLEQRLIDVWWRKKWWIKAREVQKWLIVFEWRMC